MEKVQRIQRGQKTYQFERMKHIYGVADEKSLSIIYNDDRGRERSLNVICPNKEGFKYVFKALRSITQEIQEEKKNISLDKQYLKKMWGTADKDHNGSLSRDEIFALISFMNVHMSMKLVKEMFKRVDIDNSGTLSYPEFVNFMEILRKRFGNVSRIFSFFLFFFFFCLIYLILQTRFRFSVVSNCQRRESAIELQCTSVHHSAGCF